jgi:hypothetical protein
MVFSIDLTVAQAMKSFLFWESRELLMFYPTKFTPIPIHGIMMPINDKEMTAACSMDGAR